MPLKYLFALLTPPVLALGLLLPLPAQGAAGGQDVVKATGTVTVQGDCRILTDSSGHKLALIGKLDAANGDRITVTGRKAEKTGCLNGPAIQVEKVEKAGKPQGQKAIERRGPQEGVPMGPGASAPTGPDPFTTPLKAGEVRTVRMMGTLNENVKGKDCIGFRNLRGQLWAVTGDLKKFKRGDRVRIEGVQVQPGDCTVPTVKLNTIEPYNG